jgi:hypothetical protein
MRFVVTMAAGRDLVIYADSEKAARLLLADKREAGETVAAVDGRGGPVALRALGDVLSVRAEPLAAATLVADARKAPGA